MTTYLHSIDVRLPFDITREELTMIEQMLAPLADALLASIRGEISALREEVARANDLRARADEAYAAVNAQRIAAEAQLAELRQERDTALEIAERNAAELSDVRTKYESAEEMARVAETMLKETEDKLAAMTEAEATACRARDLNRQEANALAEKVRGLETTIEHWKADNERVAEVLAETREKYNALRANLRAILD